MKIMFRTVVLLFIFFTQITFSQENGNWIKASVFTKTDTIHGFVKTKSISFDSVKFKKSMDGSTEHLTPDLIEGYKVKEELYLKRFIKKIGSFGYYKFAKLIDEGRFTLFETTEESSNSLKSPILLLDFDNKFVMFKVFGFIKLKNKKKIAQKLNDYEVLRSIVLERRFDYNSFVEEIINLNSK